MSYSQAADSRIANITEQRKLKERIAQEALAHASADILLALARELSRLEREYYHAQHIVQMKVGV